VSIVLAWLVAPAPLKPDANDAGSAKLRLVFAATVIDQARRRR
jgi:hypothetical protein